MVIHELNLILVHIPRTGGTSIESLFGQSLCDTSSPNKIVEQIGIDTWRSYYKCAFVRNPFERLVSTYSYRDQRVKYSLDDIINNRTEPIPNHIMPFSQYINIVYNLAHQNNAPIADLQTEWLLAGGKQANHPDLMKHYDAAQPVVDFIGRFERFEQDLGQILSLFGKDGPVPHLNKGQHADYRTYYSADDRAKVEEVYKSDLDRFGYGFDPAV